MQEATDKHAVIHQRAVKILNKEIAIINKEPNAFFDILVILEDYEGFGLESWITPMQTKGHKEVTSQDTNQPQGKVALD